jgi:hypothetical protein
MSRRRSIRGPLAQSYFADDCPEARAAPLSRRDRVAAWRRMVGGSPCAEPRRRKPLAVSVRSRQAFRASGTSGLGRRFCRGRRGALRIAAVASSSLANVPRDPPPFAACHRLSMALKSTIAPRESPLTLTKCGVVSAPGLTVRSARLARAAEPQRRPPAPRRGADAACVSRPSVRPRAGER